MKLKVLLCLGLCLSIFLTSCKEDEPVTPTEKMQVKISSNSQTLVEGGDEVEVTVELNREYDEIKYLYLDYGDVEGEYPNFFESSLRKDSIQVRRYGVDRPLRLLRIPFLAGEKQKVVRLKSVEDNVFRGNRPFELKVMAYENGAIQHKTGMKLNFEEKTPKPIFGIPADFASRTIVVNSKDGSTAMILPITVNGFFQFPQTVKLAFSGSAKMGTDYETSEGVFVLPPNTISPIVTSHYGFLGVFHSRDYSTPKTIQVTLVEAEEGEIASGQEFDYHRGEKIVLNDTYTVTITE